VTDADRHRWCDRNGSVRDTSQDAGLERQLAEAGWSLDDEDIWQPPPRR
jgi:hypothetical protein